MSLKKSRKAAIEAGDKFFQGDDCVRNHGGKRYTRNGGCALCRRKGGTASRCKATSTYESATKLKGHPDAFRHAVMVFGDPQRVAGCR